MEMIFMNMDNSKANEPHNFILNLSQILDSRILNNHVLQNLSIYYTGKNIRKQYKNNKLKIIAPTWNGEFNCQMVLILCQIFKIILEYITKKHETLTAICPIFVYISRINKALVFKIKHALLELQMPGNNEIIW